MWRLVWVRAIKYIDSHSEKFRNSEEHPMSFGRKKREKAESYSSEAKHCFASKCFQVQSLASPGRFGKVSFSDHQNKLQLEGPVSWLIMRQWKLLFSSQSVVPSIAQILFAFLLISVINLISGYNTYPVWYMCVCVCCTLHMLRVPVFHSEMIISIFMP